MAKYPPSNAWAADLFRWGEGQVFTDAAIRDSDARMREENEAAMGLVRADGYVQFPVFASTVDGETREKQAWLHPNFEPSGTEGFFERHRMETNIYVPSYERAGTAATMKMLDHFGVSNYYICIDPSQYPSYRDRYPAERILIRDITFRDPEMLNPHTGLRRPMVMAGHAPLCNFVLALSRSLGESHFTFSDDDILNFGLKVAKDGRPVDPYLKDNFYRCSRADRAVGFDFQTFWHRLETLAKRTRNPGFVGLEKFGVAYTSPVLIRTGTRVYSFYITSNSTQIPHSGVQNNDVVTSIELSKNGMVNMLCLGIAYNSEPTQNGGGQTAVYETFGTFEKTAVLVQSQPKVSKFVYRHHRIHHQCDFSDFRGLRPVGAAREETP